MTLVVPFDDIFNNESGLLSRHPAWERVELGEVCSILNGYALNSSLFNSTDGFPVIRIRDLARNQSATFYKGECPPDYVIDNGDLLISMDGLFGCYEWTGGQAYLNQRVCKINSDERFLHKKFLFYALNGYLKAIEEATSSVTVGHLSSRDILRIPFPLPPLKEQRRIAEKLEKMLGKVDACQKRLERIPLILKRFRQSVLAAACSGRLTADWREDDSNNESEHEFPLTWRQSIFEEFIESSFYGPRFSSSNYSSSGIPTIRTTDIQFDGSISLNDAPRLPLSSLEIEKYGLHQDDLLVTRTGATIGKCALYDSSIGRAIPSAYLIRFRFKLKIAAPKYVLLFLMSPSGQLSLVGSSTAVAQPNVNATMISKFVIPIPPLTEQQEIVRRVEALFKVADQIEARYNKAKAYVDKLAQSILAKAFRGQLAAQDPNDEPASVLLERIRAERAASEPAKKKARPLYKKKKQASLFDEA